MRDACLNEGYSLQGRMRALGMKSLPCTKNSAFSMASEEQTLCSQAAVAQVEARGVGGGRSGARAAGRRQRPRTHCSSGRAQKIAEVANGLKNGTYSAHSNDTYPLSPNVAVLASMRRDPCSTRN